jgi:serine/threonine-protein kinase
MAEVYKATYCPEGGFEKTVAVKKVLPSYAQDEAFVSMFRQEAELCSRLNHPNVVQVLDFGRFQDTYFLAMEHVDGLTLRHLIKASKGQGLPLPAVTWLGLELFAALDYVHRRAGPDGRPLGLVHRDVNPPNILVSVAGEVKLTDFGIARATEGAGLTNAGMIKGKPGYLAPEQIELKPLDERADLFAAGVTLHEALTGRHLYPSTHDAPSLFQVLQGEVRPPSAMRPEVPPELDTLVMRLLAKEKDQRVPTAAHAQALLASFRGAAAAQPDGKRLLAEAVAQARANGPISQLVTGPSDAATVPAG